MSTTSNFPPKPPRARLATVEDPPPAKRSFRPPQTKYEERDFIVPASDAKGHSARMTFRLSISMEHELTQVVNSRLFPFSDNSEVVRWCVVQGVRILESLEEIPGSVLAQVEAAMRVTAEVLYQKKYEEMFTSVEQVKDTCAGRGATTEFIRVYKDVEACFKRMPAGYWREYYLQELPRRYGHLIPTRPALVRAKWSSAAPDEDDDRGGG